MKRLRKFLLVGCGLLCVLVGTELCLRLQQWWSLGIVGVLLLAILSRFPTQAGIENFVREQIELAEMEQGRG